MDRVEKHLDLTKTAQYQNPITDDVEDFAETIKEQQARKLLETQFAQTPEKPTIGTQDQQRLEEIMDSSPIAKLAQKQ